MRAFLLDTHVVLWSLTEPERLDDVAYALIRNPQNTIWVSTASIWEMAIKVSIGKLEMPDDLEDQLRINQMNILPVTAAHALAVSQLPLLHRDPFDRMLIVQAQLEGLTIITQDARIQQYEVAWISA